MNKYKIGLVVPQLMRTHISYYKAIITLLLEKECQITVFGHIELTNELYDLFPTINYTSKQNNSSNYNFFRKIKRQANMLDLLFIEQSYGITLSYIFGFRGVKVKKLYTVHNVNSWLAPTFSLSLKAFATNLSHKYIINKSQGIVVVGSNLKDFIESLKLVGDKPTFYLPFSLNENPKANEIYKNIGTISLVVPGTINPIRRNYLTLLNAFEASLKNNINNLHLVLLGKLDFEINGTSVIADKLERIKKEFPDSITYWKKFIPDSEFHFQMSKADFIISNLNIFYPYQKNYEIYGITKETGITTLMFNYKKPAIVIGDFILPDELKSHTIRCGISELDIRKVLISVSKKEILSSQLSNNYESSIKKMDNRIENEISQLINFIQI